jgi:hypothetical protein
LTRVNGVAGSRNFSRCSTAPFSISFFCADAAWLVTAQETAERAVGALVFCETVHVEVRVAVVILLFLRVEVQRLVIVFVALRAGGG